MDSARDDPCGPGFPIRRSPDQSLLATPRNFSQPATSFIASRRQGIHQTPFSCLISTLLEAPMRRSRRAHPPGPGARPGIRRLRRRPATDGLHEDQKHRNACRTADARRPDVRDIQARPSAPEASRARLSTMSRNQKSEAWDQLRSRLRSKIRLSLIFAAAPAAPAARNPAAPARLVELNGFEPMTSCLQSRRSPS